MTVIHQHPRRTFNPEVTARYGRPTFPIKALVKYSPTYGWARMFNFPYRGSHWRPRMHTVVVSIDGPCQFNERSDPRSRGAWSVYFGPGDMKNRYGLLASSEPQTNNRAELEAVRQVIIQLQQLKVSGYFYNDFNPYKEIIIRLTSQYVQNVFHRDVWRWQYNGWRTSSGDAVKHADLIWEIHQMICNVEQHLQMAVRFWKTERHTEAAALAQRAFAGSDEADNINV